MATTSPRIAVTTPTGNVGRHVVGALVRAGVRPLLLARDPSRLDPALDGWVDVAQVDLADGDAVVAATRGVDALTWVTPSVMSDDPLGDYDRFAAVAVRAVTENRIGRVVHQSSVGAELRHGAGEIDGLAATEVALAGAAERSGADVLSLRCGYFTTNLLLDLTWADAGRLEALLPLDQPLAWVAPRDIGEVTAARLLGGGWSGWQVQAVHGPEDLTWQQVAQVLTRVTGRSVEAVRVDDDVQRQRLTGAGVPPAMVEAILGMSTGLRDGFVPEQPRTPATTTPTTLAAWCVEELLPALAAEAGGGTS